MSQTRFLGNRPIKMKPKKLIPEESIDAIFDDDEDFPVLSSTPKSKSKSEILSLSNNSLSSQEKLELSNWGLPHSVLNQYHQNGIHSMFQWQVDCLSSGQVLQGGNLVYSAPTSAGKTLVAELLMLKKVLESRKKAILIFPFVSIAREKMFTLKKLLKDCHVRVGGFMGSQHPRGGFKAVDIAVCTIEKANSLVNRLLEDSGTFEKLGIIVVDELHLLGDPQRGYLLELLLTKIQFVTGFKTENSVQIVGMSATLPNLDLLSKWLKADLYKTDFRPVPLQEHIKVGTKLFNNQFGLVRNIQAPIRIPNDSEGLVYLSLETVLNGHSVLVFCPTKNWCEKLSGTISKEFFNIGKPPNGPDQNQALTKIRAGLQSQLNGPKLKEVLEQLKRCPAGLDSVLAKAISFGVAYHHAGLTFDERDIVEGKKS